MPAKKSGPKAAEAAAESAPAVADEAQTAESADSTESTDETEAEPMNRAERRARGKGKSAPQPTDRGRVAGSHGPAATQRMWANRRSG